MLLTNACGSGATTVLVSTLGCVDVTVSCTASLVYDVSLASALYIVGGGLSDDLLNQTKILPIYLVEGNAAVAASPFNVDGSEKFN